MAKKKKHKTEGPGVPKSVLNPAQVQQKIDEGVSNVISMYCFHYGDKELKPPVEPKVCPKISPEDFCCTVYTSEYTSPAKKCRVIGYNEEGIPETVIGCAFSPLEEFERLRQEWAKKGRKINPLKAAKRARRGK